MKLTCLPVPYTGLHPLAECLGTNGESLQATVDVPAFAS